MEFLTLGFEEISNFRDDKGKIWWSFFNWKVKFLGPAMEIAMLKIGGRYIYVLGTPMPMLPLDNVSLKAGKQTMGRIRNTSTIETLMLLALGIQSPSENGNGT